MYITVVLFCAATQLLGEITPEQSDEPMRLLEDGSWQLGSAADPDADGRMRILTHGSTKIGSCKGSDERISRAFAELEFVTTAQIVLYLLLIPAILCLVTSAIALGREQERERHQAEKETRDENQNR